MPGVIGKQKNMKKKKDNSEDLFKELQEALTEATEFANQNSDIFENKPAGLMSIKKALKSDDPLVNIRKEMGDRTKEQKTYVLLFAAILEINSSGVFELFLNLDMEEVDTIYREYKKLGAELLCSQIEEIREFLKKKLRNRYKTEHIFGLLGDEDQQKLDRKLAKQHKAVCEEIETKLLEFVKMNIDKLENK